MYKHKVIWPTKNLQILHAWLKKVKAHKHPSIHSFVYWALYILNFKNIECEWQTIFYMSNAPVFHPLLMNEAVMNGSRINEFMNGSQMSMFSYHFLVFLAYKQCRRTNLKNIEYSVKCIGIEIQFITWNDWYSNSRDNMQCNKTISL
mgnify:FL=1